MLKDDVYTHNFEINRPFAHNQSSVVIIQGAVFNQVNTVIRSEFPMEVKIQRWVFEER